VDPVQWQKESGTRIRLQEFCLGVQQTFWRQDQLQRVAASFYEVAFVPAKFAVADVVPRWDRFHPCRQHEDIL